MKRNITARLSCVCLAPLIALSLGFQTGAFAQTAPKRVALLVGVSDYADPNMPDLEGPVNDVAALRDVLVRRWGFRPQDIKTLVDGEATRANIVKELNALSSRSAVNDEVLVYFSGHGTSALDADAIVALPHGSGAFVPADFKNVEGADASSLIVGRTDLVPVFKALEKGGRRMWVISDSCYSGSQVRGLAMPKSDELPTRMIPLRLGKAAYQQRKDMSKIDTAPPPEPYPYHATAFLSASGEGESAKDIPKSKLNHTPTIDDKPHGAFTDALLRVLDGKIAGDLDGDGLLSLNEVQSATSDFMASRAYAHSPRRLPSVADDPEGLGNRSVLNVSAVATKPKEQTVKPLRVRLDGISPTMAKTISGIPDAIVVKPGEPSDITLKIPNGASVLGVLTAGGDLLAGMPATDTDRAAAQVRQLAWAQRLRSKAEKYRRGALQAEIDPAVYNGNFVPGKLINFVVKPDRKATLVLLNVDSNGKVGVLYPYTPSEDQPLPAGQAKHIPGTAKHLLIEVKEPFGMDMQFVFAFDEPPPGLSGLHQLVDADPGDARLLAFERGLSTMAGKYTFASTNLRTLKP